MRSTPCTNICRLALGLCLGAFLALSGCSCGGDGNGENGENGGNGQPVTRTGPTVVVQTAGGAVIQTPEHRLRIAIGAPQPVGAAASETHRLDVGPVPR